MWWLYLGGVIVVAGVMVAVRHAWIRSRKPWAGQI